MDRRGDLYRRIREDGRESGLYVQFTSPCQVFLPLVPFGQSISIYSPISGFYTTGQPIQSGKPVLMRCRH